MRILRVPDERLGDGRQVLTVRSRARTCASVMAAVGMGLLALGTLHSGLGDLGGDNAQYILLAKSLATGQGFRSLQEPGAPIHTLYPFGFPLLLSPIVALWGSHAHLPMHAMVIGWGLLCLFLWARWVREGAAPAAAGGGGTRRLGAPGLRLAAVVCVGTTPLWVYSYGQVLSEFPYIAFSLCAFLLIRRGRPARWLPLFLALLAAYFTRTVGIVLIVSVLAWIGWRRSREGVAVRPVILLAAALLLPILGWHGRSQAVAAGPAAPSYLHPFLLADPYQPDLGPLTLGRMGLRLVENGAAWVTTLGRELVWPTTLAAPWVASFAGGVLALLIAAGFLRRIPSRSGAEGYVACYLLVILLWPFREGRFLLPVLPWLWLYLLEGMALLLERAGRLARAGLVAGNIAGCAWVVGLNLAGIHYPPALRGFVGAHDWIRANTPPEAVILSRKPTVTALLAERQAVLFPYTEDGERIWERMRRDGVTHVVIDGVFQQTQQYLVPAIREHLDRFEPEIVRFGPARLLTVRQRRREIS